MKLKNSGKVIKFHNNKTLKFIIKIEFYICLVFPLISIIFGVLNRKTIIETLKFLIFIFIFCIAIIMVAGLLINLIINIFQKPSLYVYKDYFLYKRKDIRFDEVDKIKYALNVYTRHVSDAILYFYRENDKLCKIRNPSLTSVLFLFSKCKNAKKKIVSKKTYKAFLWVYAITIIFWLFMIFVI